MSLGFFFSATEISAHGIDQRTALSDFPVCNTPIEIAPEVTGHGLPLNKCEAYNRVYDQPYESR